LQVIDADKDINIDELHKDELPPQAGVTSPHLPGSES
jgi:hypothetical protein